MPRINIEKIPNNTLECSYVFESARGLPQIYPQISESDAGIRAARSLVSISSQLNAIRRHR
jgi:hypothetical protein